VYCDDKEFDRLAGEQHIVELISLGAPLPGILNKLRTAIDLQIGNVVSLVLLPDEDENRIGSITQSAMQVGLNIFSSTRILSRRKTVLGTLEIYSCDPRQPTPYEVQVMKRAIHLVGIALQRHADDEEFERTSRCSRREIGGALESPPFIN